MSNRLYNAQYSLVFMVGKFDTNNVNHEKLQHDLEEENKFYGDILQCNFTDSYNSLPTKVST